MFSYNQEKSRHSTQLIVEKNLDAGAYNTESGISFIVKALTLKRNPISQGFNYYRLSDLSKAHTIEILLRDENEPKNIELPEDMLHRIAEYMSQKQHIAGRFDCASFAHAANGIPYKWAEFNEDSWKQEPYIYITKI